jgi:hypothetical protein
MRGAGVQAAMGAKAKAETRTASFVPTQQIETGRGRLRKSKTTPSMGTGQPARPAGLGDRGKAREKKLADWLLPANTIKYAGCACACLCQSGAVFDS